LDAVVRIPLAEWLSAAELRSPGSRGVSALRWFVAGPENALLCAAIDAALRRDSALGPLVLWGSSGVGKSHLVRGLAARLEQGSPPWNVHVVLAAEITSDEWITSRHPLQPGAPLRGLADLDLFVVEDVSDLKDRPVAQQQLVHHLDEIARHGGLAIVTSRSPVGEMRELMPRLRSRLIGGAVVPICLPEPLARRTLLNDWAALLGVPIAEDAADALAARLELGPPQLRGALVSLACNTDGRLKAIDLPAAQAFLAARASTDKLSLRTVAAKTARYFGLTLATLKSSSRLRQVVEARAVAMYLARQLTGSSFQQIGAYFGGRDHTTVLHNYRRTEQLQSTDAGTRHTLAVLQESLTHLRGGKHVARLALSAG
jgi:chromosomal replication initiator protein